MKVSVFREYITFSNESFNDNNNTNGILASKHYRFQCIFVYSAGFLESHNFQPLASTARNGWHSVLHARLPPSTSDTGVKIDLFFGLQIAQRIKNIILKNIL